MKRLFVILLLLPSVAFAQQNDDAIETLFGDAQGIRGFAGIHFDATSRSVMATRMSGAMVMMTHQPMLS